ncbi:hypothetical protein PD5205_01324 [Xanthomonas fragariae]|uniref:Uncharacterized protein n=1 Tax=Xanthomonas fragariae TaxID=48664 RepID=A0A1Y6HDK2_9XANT|nr:hypothetical protein NBC2815_01357 [Xanthomonas fragariae]SMQ99912.1 hypothetical protein PD885_02682 [Xanthomonas fragariae]SMR02635.1 hypothetical protein PD5205_01324 [Xanthomonas fragariae]
MPGQGSGEGGGEQGLTGGQSGPETGDQGTWEGGRSGHSSGTDPPEARVTGVPRTTLSMDSARSDRSGNLCLRQSRRRPDR